MHNKHDEQKRSSQFSNQNEDSDISGQKGGTSQQNYRDTSETPDQADLNEDSDKESNTW